jgi:hypothetical protein
VNPCFLDILFVVNAFFIVLHGWTISFFTTI